MRTQSSLLCGVAIGALIAMTMASGAEAKTHHKHMHAAAPAENGEVKQLADQVDVLMGRLNEETQARQQDEAALQQAQAEAASAKADAEEARGELAQQIQTIPGEVNTAIAAAKPKTDKIYYKGVTITMGGFAAAESATRSRDETADIGSSFAKIPYANDPAAHAGETIMTARQSRYSLLVQGDPNATTHLGFYGEFDFLGAAQTANSGESNSYQLRIRNLYGQADWDNGWHLLAGQSWSLATMNSKGITPRNETPPPTIDAQYVPGFVWARQAQVRVTKDFNKQFWLAVSVENPQTPGISGKAPSLAGGAVITTTQAPTSQFYSGTNYSLNSLPDVVAKVAYEDTLSGHSVHAEVFGVARQFKDRITAAAGTTTAAGSTSNSSGGGVGGGIALGVVPKLVDLTASVLGGEGLGRYGSGQLSDVTYNTQGHLVGIPETLWMAGLTVHATSALDLYVYGGAEDLRSKKFYNGTTLLSGFGPGVVASNAVCNEEGSTLSSCTAETKSISQITTGLWDKVYNGPFGSFRVGLQYSHTDKKAFADATTLGIAPKTNDDMIFTSIRYYPF